MFKPSLTDKAFDDFLIYLKDIKKCEPVSFIDFINHFCPKYKDTYLLMKKLKENGHINYNEMVSSVPVSITEIGIDFIENTTFVKESKNKYENKQTIMKSFSLNRQSLTWVIITAALTLIGIIVAIYFGCNNQPSK